MDKRKLFVGNVSPDDVAKRAQVMLVDGERWWIKAPAPYRCYGEGETPKVSCPVVDCSSIPDDDEMLKRMAYVIGDCVNLAGLLEGLEALGGRVLTTKDTKKHEGKDKGLGCGDESRGAV